jgi:predicted kinase
MSKKLIMTRGLPGSGKSSWAREAVAIETLAGRKANIICKDDIRKDWQKTGWTWSQKGEEDVIRMRDALIKACFANGSGMVIVADTNFGKHEARLRQISKECDAVFIIQDFTNVPVIECIERDSKRPTSERVGPEVIKRMYNDYIAVTMKELPVQYKPDPYAQRAIICDLDGTVALHNQRRSPYNFAQVGQDTVNDPVADIVKFFASAGHVILYVSGRDAWCADLTTEWLRKNGLPIPGELHKLFMRGDTDKRKDNIVKQEIFDTHIRNHYNVRCVLDDRDQVVKMWRSLGLVCLQVAEGNF